MIHSPSMPRRPLLLIGLALLAWVLVGLTFWGGVKVLAFQTDRQRIVHPIEPRATA